MNCHARIPRKPPDRSRVYPERTRRCPKKARQFFKISGSDLLASPRTENIGLCDDHKSLSSPKKMSLESLYIWFPFQEKFTVTPTNPDLVLADQMSDYFRGLHNKMRGIVDSDMDITDDQWRAMLETVLRERVVEDVMES